MADAFVGIDVAFAKRKRLPVSVCTWRDGRLVPEALRLLPLTPPRGQGNVATLDETRVSEFVREAVDYVLQVCNELQLTPRRIAIDAPSAPRAEGVRRRAAEAAMDEAGISCFTTPTATEFADIREKVRGHLAGGGPENRLPHANQLWMLVGFRLFEELSKIAPCIEVFPQATARVLGAGSVHKGKVGGVEAQLAEAARDTGWPANKAADPDFSDIGFGPAHDRLDAYLSAWVAALEEGDRIPFGKPPGDVIWTPRLGLAEYEKPKVVDKPRARLPRRNRPNQPSAGSARSCPGCEDYVFKRWPLGWDAHAAHRCGGLSARDPEERKREFKRRFGHVFVGRMADK